MNRNYTFFEKLMIAICVIVTIGTVVFSISQGNRVWQNNKIEELEAARDANYRQQKELLKEYLEEYHDVANISKVVFYIHYNTDVMVYYKTNGNWYQQKFTLNDFLEERELHQLLWGMIREEPYPYYED